MRVAAALLTTTTLALGTALLPPSALGARPGEATSAAGAAIGSPASAPARDRVAAPRITVRVKTPHTTLGTLARFSGRVTNRPAGANRVFVHQLVPIPKKPGWAWRAVGSSYVTPKGKWAWAGNTREPVVNKYRFTVPATDRTPAVSTRVQKVRTHGWFLQKRGFMVKHPSEHVQAPLRVWGSGQAVNRTLTLEGRDFTDNVLFGVPAWTPGPQKPNWAANVQYGWRNQGCDRAEGMLALSPSATPQERTVVLRVDNVVRKVVTLDRPGALTPFSLDLTGARSVRVSTPIASNGTVLPSTVNLPEFRMRCVGEPVHRSVRYF